MPASPGLETCHPATAGKPTVQLDAAKHAFRRDVEAKEELDASCTCASPITFPGVGWGVGGGGGEAESRG